MSLFLTGTDTNVGKTYVASLMIRAERKAAVDCVGFKPICCGDRADAIALHAASGGAASVNEINPVWLRPPLAPFAAAMIEGRHIDLDLIRDGFARLRAAHQSVIVEGAGGWLVPITRDYFMSDLAAEMGLPVAVVVANRLGAINHALLTIRAIRAQGLECAGLILNHPSSPSPEANLAATTNRAVLESLVDVPILREVAWEERSG